MEIIAAALAGYEFVDEPEVPAAFPDGWAPDIDAFRSGLDLSDPWLSGSERRLHVD